MNQSLRALYSAFAVFVVLSMPQSGYAVTLMPLTLVMEQSKAVVSLHVRNDEAQAKIFEVQAFHWSQDGREDVLEPASDLVVTPPIVKLAPGEERVIRVGVMRKDSSRTLEKAYRLLLRDITPIALEGGELHLRMQYLLPLFMSPSRPQPELQLIEAATPDGSGCIQITNAGNIHAKLVWTAPIGAPQSITPTQRYVLAGAKSLICPDYPAAKGDRLIAGITSAYQNEVTSYEVSPFKN